MTPAAALDLALHRAGSQAKLAAICGCTQGAVWQMLKKPSARLSVPYVLKVEAAFGISRHDLRPDVYPAPADQPIDPSEQAAA